MSKEEKEVKGLEEPIGEVEESNPLGKGGCEGRSSLTKCPTGKIDFEVIKSYNVEVARFENEEELAETMNAASKKFLEVSKSVPVTIFDTVKMFREMSQLCLQLAECQLNAVELGLCELEDTLV